MAVYYYACRLSAACGAVTDPPAPAARPATRHRPISKQPTASKVKVNGILPGKKNAQLSIESDMRLEEIPANTPEARIDNSVTEDELCFEGDNLVSGRLEALVQHVIPTADYYPDRAFIFAFLLSSRLFIKPHDLLGQITAAAYPLPKDKTKTEDPPEQLILLLTEWSETFPYDFRDERVMAHVREVAHCCVSADGPIRSEVSQLLQNLLHRLTKLEQYEAFLHSIHTASSTADVDALSQSDVNGLCGTAVCLAQQLTHIEAERLSYIGPEEFISSFLLEPSGNSEPQLTKNYDNYVEWSGRLRSLVVTEICRHSKGKKIRASIIEFWITTAKECFEIGNLNSLMSIVEGLNSKPVARLKKTWAKVDRSVLDELEEASGEDEYDALLTAPLGPGRHVVPHFPRHVSTMHALCRKCLTKLPNDHVNFEHFWQLAKQVTEFITWKQVHCPFSKQPKVITYLQATPVLNEEAAAVASFECEPPENEAEEEKLTALLSQASNS